MVQRSITHARGGLAAAAARRDNCGERAKVVSLMQGHPLTRTIANSSS